MISDTAACFSESVAALLQDASDRARLGQAARATAERYGWPFVGARFGEVLRSVVEGSSKVVPARAKAENLSDVPLVR